MKRTNFFLLIFIIPGAIGYNSRIASASDAFDECVMGQMAGQNIYMLPLAQKICREILPPAPRETVQPAETDLTQEIEHNICSAHGEEVLSICITNPPKDKAISRVVGFFGNRNPCIIDEKVPLELSGKRTIVHLSNDMIVKKLWEDWFTSNKYSFGYDKSAYNCYKIEIRGYENCHWSLISGLSCP